MEILCDELLNLVGESLDVLAQVGIVEGAELSLGKLRLPGRGLWSLILGLRTGDTTKLR